MKKSKIVWIIIAVSLIILGAVISTLSLARLNFDFSNLNTQKYVSNEHIVTEDFSNIKIDVDTSDIELVRSENNECMIVSVDTDKVKHIVACNSPGIHSSDLTTIPFENADASYFPLQDAVWEE